MTLPFSGQLSLGDIADEKGVPQSNVSLEAVSTEDVNEHSSNHPDGEEPHSVSEFHGYDHEALPDSPENFSASHVFGACPDRHVLVSWSQPDHAPDVVLEYSTNGSSWQPLATTRDSFTHTDAQPENNWYRGRWSGQSGWAEDTAFVTCPD